MRTIEGIKFYSMKETASLLGLTTRTIMSYLKNGRLKGVKIGREWHISEENIQKFIKGE